MDTTRAQQKALDDDLVAPANRLQIRKCNLRLNFTLKSKEPTLQVVLDALKLTSFYKAFEITADVLEIYMQEFLVTASRHHSSLHLKMNSKSHTVNVDNFRDMLQICLKLPCQKFEDPPFEEEILSFIREIGHTVNDDNEQTKSDNDDDNFVHPKLSTFDEKERQYKEDKEEEWSDDEAYDEETHRMSTVRRTNWHEEETNEEDEVNELYKDVNVNLEGRDTEMIDVPQTNVQGFISNMLNPNPDKGIDSILNLNTGSTSLVDVPVTTNVEMPSFHIVTTLLQPPTLFIQPQQQTLVSTPTIILSTSLQNLPTFGSLFKFDNKVKGLEDDFLEFKQTDQFAEVVSSIPGIVDTYLANKMNEAIKIVVQLQSDRLRDEAQAENEDFINTLDENMWKIIKKKVKDQVKE
ncbi:hypothetical protein Tco_1327604 [Tanacetum coccineum]